MDKMIAQECPFCGEMTEVRQMELGAYYVVCLDEDDCGFEGPFGNSEEDAIEKWNSITIKAKEE